MSRASDLVIFGAGGLARETAFFVRELADAGETWSLQGFVVEDPGLLGRDIAGLPVLGGVEHLKQTGYAGAAVVAVGAPELSHRILAQITAAGLELSFPVLRHPSAIGDWSRVELARGVVLAPGTILTTSVEVAEFAYLNTGAVLTHDVRVGAHSRLNPRALLCGGVCVEDDVTIGAASVVLQGVRIGRGAQVAIGAVVGGDVAPQTLVAGNPARLIKRLAAAGE